MSSSGEITVVAPMTALVRRLPWVVAIPLSLSAVAVGWTWLTRDYVAESVFMPEARGAQATQLAGLAAQFGISLGSSDPALSVDFYRSLIYGRELLSTAVQSEYRFTTDDDPPRSLATDLIELYADSQRTHSERLFQAQQSLREQVYIGIDRPAGIVTVSVTAEWPQLAEQINRRLLELVNQFNLEKLQLSATARRDFARERLSESEAALAEAERKEREFLEANRGFENSPELSLTYRRLQRDVAFAQQLLTTVAQSYEQARVDAIRDVPVITIVEAPEGSAHVDRRLRTSAVFGFLLGVALVIGLISLASFLAAERREHPEAYAQFDGAWSEAMRRLRLQRR